MGRSVEEEVGLRAATCNPHVMGEQILRDRLGHTLGYYDEKRDQTRDRLGNLLGYGNLLGTLVPRR